VDRIACLERDLARRNTELQAANHRMKSDLEAAAKVQKALLPRGPLEIPGVRLAWHFQPCDELAGDLLNVVRLDDRYVALYVLDVVGHGVKSALMAVMVSRAITQLLSPSQAREARRACGPRLMSPDRVVAALDRAFPWDDQTEQFCALLYGILDLKTGKFDFVAAGHPGPLSIPLTGKARSLTAPGPPVGLGTGKYRASSTTLRAGDRLYLYSDGVPEARDASGQCFGQERLLQALEQTRTLPLPDALAAVVHRIGAWYGPATPHDDVSMLTIEYTGVFADLPGTAQAAGQGALAGAE
jgi:sigma-B regulation protein RsbU (phosphoserine phosphatase)